MNRGMVLTDKKIMEYGVYVLVIFLLFCGHVRQLNIAKLIIGVYIPASLLILGTLYTGKFYRFRKCPVFVCLVLFAFSGIVSTIFAKYPSASLAYFEKDHVRNILIYLIIVIVFNTEEKIKKVSNIIAWTSIIYIIQAWYFYLPALIRSGGLAKGGFPNASWPLQFTVPFIFLSIYFPNSRTSQRWWVFVLFLSCVTVILAGSRSPVVGIAASAGIWLMYGKKKLRVKLIITIILIVLTTIIFFGNLISVSVYKRENIQAQDRLYMYQSYMGVVKKYPFFGTGLDHLAMLEEQLSAFKGDYPRGYLSRKCHNTYLTVTVRQGFIGLGAYITLLVVSIISIMRKLSNNADSYNKGIGITLLSSIVGIYIVSGLVTTWSLLTLGLLLGLTGAYLSIEERNSGVKSKQKMPNG